MSQSWDRTSEGADAGESMVGFELGDTRFGLPITRVREIISYEAPMALPSKDGGLEGVLSVRGDTVTIVNLRARLQMPPIEPTGEMRIILCDLPIGTVGYTVDRANEIVRVNVDAANGAAATLRALQQEYVQNVAQVGDDLLLILNPDKLVDAPAVEAALEHEQASGPVDLQDQALAS